MSSFEENYETIVKDNKNEILGLMHQMHALGPAFQAFHQICKQHKIKPLRKQKGQYNPNKRHLSAYNIFTQDVQKDNRLKDKPFQERSQLIGVMWKKVKADKAEHQKYKDMADERKKEVHLDSGNNDEIIVPVNQVAPVVAPAPVPVVVAPVVTKPQKGKKAKEVKEVPKKTEKVKPDKVKPVSRGRKNKGEPERVVDPSDVSEEDVFLDNSDEEDAFESDAEVSD